MPETASGPLIVQSDRTVLLEVAHPQAEDARHDLSVGSPGTELEFAL